MLPTLYHRNRLFHVPSLFDEFFKDFESAPQESFSPALNLREEDDAYYASVELPGVQKDDVDVSLKDHVLTIKGEKKSEIEDKKEGYYRVERSYGSFARSIRLPETVKQDEISANLENGVLEIKVPKGERPDAKKITVN